MGQEKESSAMSSVLLAKMSARDKSKCLDFLMDDDSHPAPDISDIFKMSKIDYSLNSFKKNVPLPMDNHIKLSNFKNKNNINFP